MDKLIYFGLWFGGNAAEAAEFYVSLFPGSRIAGTAPGPDGRPIVVEWEIARERFVGINGGPMYRPNPSVSYFVTCESDAETDRLWNALTDGGTVMMPLDAYPWSPRYGFVEDRFGVSWQIARGEFSDVGQKIAPCLTFVGGVYGRAEEAIGFYCSVFPESSVDGIARHGPDEPFDREGTVTQARFAAGGCKFMVTDSGYPHAFSFSEGNSFIVNCGSQQEIDHYWEKLSSGGGSTGRCGWLKDKFGVSWQVVPKRLGELMRGPNAAAVGAALMTMDKLEMAALEAAAEVL